MIICNSNYLQKNRLRINQCFPKCISFDNMSEIGKQECTLKQLFRLDQGAFFLQHLLLDFATSINA